MAQITLNFDPIVQSFHGLVNSLVTSTSRISKTRPKTCDCGDVCPPKLICPPRCLLDIRKTASVGERIVVHFNVMNQHTTARQYKLGVRPLTDDKGQVAPQQPQLDIHLINLEPGQYRSITMVVDLANFKSGHIYQTDIVVRENEFNQNICFTLCVQDHCTSDTAYPWDERRVYNEWLGWQRHFRCEPDIKEDAEHRS